jgi:hypothetical protein
VAPARALPRIALLAVVGACGRLEYQPIDAALDTPPAVVPDGSLACGTFAIDDRTISLEAELGELTPPFTPRTDPTTSCGAYLVDGDVITGLMTAGRARYPLTITSAGTYRIWGLARAEASETDRDSFFLSIDGDPAIVYQVVNRDYAPEWGWRLFLTDASDFTLAYERVLSAGPHELVLTSREGSSRLDRLIITSDVAFVP